MDTKLHSLLSHHRAAIAQGWYDAIIGTYPAESAQFLRRENNQFANPVGQNIASAAQIIVKELLRDPTAPTEELTAALDSVVRLRAIQGFSAGRAVGFVFALKDVVQHELGTAAGPAQLRDFDRLVDNLALHAFEIYMGCREKMAEIRVKELKNRTFKLVERVNALPPRASGGASGRDASPRGPRKGRTERPPGPTQTKKKQD